MSRSILALARSVLDPLAMRPWVAFPAIAICLTELWGAQSVRSQLPDLSGNETAETAKDDRSCDRPASATPDSEEESREKCDDRSHSEAFSPPAGIAPPMFGYSPSETVPQRPAIPAPTMAISPSSHNEPQPSTAQTVLLDTPQPVNRVTPPAVAISPSTQSEPRSSSSLLDSAPPALFAPPDSAMAMGNTFSPTSGSPTSGSPTLGSSPAVPKTPDSRPLVVPTPPPGSSTGTSTVVPAPPSLPPRLPSFEPSVSTPTSTRSVPPNNSPRAAIGCGLDDACAIPHPNEGVLSTRDLVAALPSQFSFEDNADNQAANPNLSQVSEVAHASDVHSLRQEALTPARYQFQGVYIYQGDEASARARISGVYPLAPTVALGGSFDVTDGTAFTDSQTQGGSINELYVVASIPDVPNLRFSLGQMDLTSYFDRNSFAKDGATHFFNSVFQTNPALSRTGIGSRTGLLVNWSVTDNVEAKVAGFSSARRLEDFQIDGVAAELGIRQGNFIVRGTFATARDAGVDDGFREIFQLERSNGGTGLLTDDREQAYGVNAEVFVPEIGLGLFGRYGHYENIDADVGADTFSVGMNILDLFLPRDRFGIAYGQDLSNDSLRREQGDKLPDVLEAFYDVALLPNVRVGFSFQSLNEFSDTILGVRVKTEFDMTPLQRYP